MMPNMMAGVYLAEDEMAVSPDGLKIEESGDVQRQVIGVPRRNRRSRTNCGAAMGGRK